MDLKGKVINFLGDSITEGVGVTGNNRFDQIIGRELGCIRVNNYGIGGTRIAHQTTPSAKARYDLDFCGRSWDMDREAALIVVYGGVNDYAHGDAPLGDADDMLRTTFCGSLNYLCSNIRELYPGAKCVFMTPAHCKGDRDVSLSPQKPQFAERRMLWEYVRKIVEIAPLHGFSVYNMYEDLGIDPNNPDECDKYTVDGLHFNDEGHRAIAEKLIPFIRSL